MVEPQYVEGSSCCDEQFKPFKTFKQFKSLKTNALGSEIFEHHLATRLDSRRFENLIVPREIEG